MFLNFMHMVRAGPFKRVIKKAKIFALAKGFRGRRKNCYSLAVRCVHKALQYQYKGRKLKKRNMRKLWIQRINFGVREHSLPYSILLRNLCRSNVAINRKVLSELAIHEPRTFHALAQLAKDRQRDGLLAALD
ncbi:large ribosomal subunit protein bL20 [Hydra vulgaris]|uniref:Large ribosomal subunit protein bL20c n=1 Tax=Hydra vulgaris TaxID=6087 RepID=T2M6J8_HYDVU|nr:50S ribosomal protein L20-like [Hydra vulgaris]